MATDPAHPATHGETPPPDGTPADGPRLTVPARGGRVPGIALLGLAVAVLAGSAWHGGVTEALAALPVAALLAVIGWFVFLDQRLEIGPGGIDLVRSVTAAHVPWADFAGADVHWGLRIVTTTGRTVSWSALAGRTGSPENSVRDAMDRADVSARGNARRSHIARMQSATRTGGATAFRADERTRSRGAMPMTRWTDPHSRARERAALTAAEAAEVLTVYAEQRRAVDPAARTGATAGLGVTAGARATDAATTDPAATDPAVTRTAPRLPAILALGVTLVAVILVRL